MLVWTIIAAQFLAATIIGAALFIHAGALLVATLGFTPAWRYTLTYVVVHVPIVAVVFLGCCVILGLHWLQALLFGYSVPR